MDLTNIALPLLMSTELHARGHQSVGGELGVPMSIHHKGGYEKWRSDPKSQADKAAIHGAGFQTQDDIARRMDEDSEFARSYRLANALYKAAYLAGSDKIFAKGSGIKGDPDALERTSGNRYAKHMLGITALVDILKSRGMMKNHDVTFDAGEGTPKLIYTVRW